jgi:hypothetical protein
MTPWFRRLSLGSRITALTAGARRPAQHDRDQRRADRAANRNGRSPAHRADQPVCGRRERLLAMALADRPAPPSTRRAGSTTTAPSTPGSSSRSARSRETERLLRGEARAARALASIRQQLASWRADVADPMVAAVATDGPDRPAALSRGRQTRFSGILQAITSSRTMRRRCATTARQGAHLEHRGGGPAVLAAPWCWSPGCCWRRC